VDRLDTLRIFIAAAEAGSFAAAGRQLRRSRDLVSKAVAELEADLGRPLFHRTTRRIELTDAGNAYRGQIQPLLLELNAADARIRGGSDEAHGRLRVNAPMAWSNVVLAPMVGRFLQRHPQIQLDLVLDDRALDPIPAHVDVTLRIAAAPDTPLASERFGEVHRALYAAPAYLERKGRPRTPEDLAAHDCLHYGFLATGSEWVLARGATQRRVKVGGPLACNSGAVLAAAVAQGAGIALLPEFLALSRARRPGIERVLPGWRIQPLTLYAFIPPSRQVSQRVRAFCAFIKSELRA
jgi:DNA-binding transcriptional LysR family regulator